MEELRLIVELLIIFAMVTYGVAFWRVYRGAEARFKAIETTLLTHSTKIEKLEGR